MTAPALPVAHVLDARPVTVYTVHCGSCGVVYLGEYGPVWFTEDQLSNLDAFEMDGWETDVRHIDPDFAGHALVCPKCWEVSWCEECHQPIHVWQQVETESLGYGEATWHAECCTEQHAHVARSASTLIAPAVEPVGGTQ